MPSNRNLSLTYTNRCSAACRHCCVAAGPAGKEKLAPEVIVPHLPGFHDCGVREIRYSGGEPLLFIDELAVIAAACGVRRWRQVVFSNGFWAGNSRRAAAWAGRLHEMGIDQVVLSTSRFHVEYVPATNLKRAVKALRNAGVGASILLMYDDARTLENASLFYNVQRTGAPYTYNYFLPDGRGRGLDDEKIHPRQTQASVLAAACPLRHQIHVDGNGDVLPCCTATGTSIQTRQLYRFGNLNTDRTHIVTRRLGTELHRTLAEQGPGGIYRRAKRGLLARGFRPQETYAGVCRLCAELLGNEAFVDAIIAAFPDANGGDDG